MTALTEAPPSTGPLVDVELPSDPLSGRLARQAVDVLADELHPETFAKLRLLVTELVVAALGPPATRAVRLVVHADGAVVRADITMVGGAVPSPAGPRRPMGYGALLLEHIADRRGTLPRDEGVWFEIARRERPRRRVGHSANP